MAFLVHKYAPGCFTPYLLPAHVLPSLHLRTGSPYSDSWHCVSVPSVLMYLQIQVSMHEEAVG